MNLYVTRTDEMVSLKTLDAELEFVTKYAYPIVVAVDINSDSLRNDVITKANLSRLNGNCFQQIFHVHASLLIDPQVSITTSQ